MKGPKLTYLGRNPPNNANRSRNYPFNLDPESIQYDLTTDKPQWPFSAYGANREVPKQLFGGPMEQSPEELRVQYYLGMAANDTQQAVSTVSYCILETANTAPDPTRTKPIQ